MYLGAVVVIVCGMLGLSYLLGERHHERGTDEPYESGVLTTGSARIPFPAHFYVTAMLFVIFDLEIVFLFAWAVAARQLGWPGYIEIVIFVSVLTVAWAYLWRVGALDWGTSSKLRQLGKSQVPPDRMQESRSSP